MQFSLKSLIIASVIVAMTCATFFAMPQGPVKVDSCRIPGFGRELAKIPDAETRENRTQKGFRLLLERNLLQHQSCFKATSLNDFFQWAESQISCMHGRRRVCEFEFVRVIAIA